MLHEGLDASQRVLLCLRGRVLAALEWGATVLRLSAVVVRDARRERERATGV